MKKRLRFGALEKKKEEERPMHQIPFCPNKDCGYHYQAHAGDRYVGAGFYSTKTFGKVQRFRCRASGKYFST